MGTLNQVCIVPSTDELCMLICSSCIVSRAVYILPKLWPQSPLCPLEQVGISSQWYQSPWSHHQGCGMCIALYRLPCTSQSQELRHWRRSVGRCQGLRVGHVCWGGVRYQRPVDPVESLHAFCDVPSHMVSVELLEHKTVTRGGCLSSHKVHGVYSLSPSHLLLYPSFSSSSLFAFCPFWTALEAILYIIRWLYISTLYVCIPSIAPYQEPCPSISTVWNTGRGRVYYSVHTR